MADTGSVDVSLAPNSSVILEPAESLSFHLQAQTAPQAVLTIRNVSDTRKIAFKVKTTRPLRYLVRPNQGMLGPNGSASIMVILQQRDCDELLRLDPSERLLSNDKFLVQSIFADDGFYESVKTKSAKEMADELTNMWARTDKKSLSNKKLRCRFVQDDQSASAAAAALPSAESPHSKLLQSKGSSIYSSSNSLLPVKPVDLTPLRTAAAAAQSDAAVSTPAQLSAALLQESTVVADKTAVHKNDQAVPKDTISDVAALRKKYDELVAFTVQLTAQRDVLMTDLDKTYPPPRPMLLLCLLQKASADAQRVKKLNDDATSGSTLRQRKPNGAGNASSDADASSSLASNRPGARDPAAFGLFHLLVCAIIFFLVGRYA